VPYLVFVVRVQIQATLLRALPVLRYALVDVRLVDDLRNQLRLFVDCAGVRRRELAAEDGIFATGGDKETEQRPHAVHCEAQDDDGDEKEYGDASPHGDCGSLRASFSLVMVQRTEQGSEEMQKSRARGSDVVLKEVYIKHPYGDVVWSRTWRQEVTEDRRARRERKTVRKEAVLRLAKRRPISEIA
jgi:hypothetical protein